jgi:excisionase family DNA binding protein
MLEGSMASSEPLTVAEAAAILGIETSSVRHAIRSGRLAARKIGRDWWLRPEDVQAYKANRRNSGRPFRRSAAAPM